MPYLYVKQKVKDFDKWYAVFKSDASAQKEAGLSDLQLLRDTSDRNTVICIFRIQDMGEANRFTNTPDAEKSKNESGVIGTPEVLILEKI